MTDYLCGFSQLL